MSVSQSLWVHQGSAVIIAESHDIWGFTPEFLLSNDIVPDSWPCSRATRAQDSVDIQFGPIHWRMTERQLWISVIPDCPFDDCPQPELGPLFIDSTMKYLEAVPYLPARRFWFFWKISAIDSNRQKWLADTFLRREWPVELGVPRIQPLLTSRKDDVVLHMTIKEESAYRKGSLEQDSIVFDSYVYRDVGQTPSEIILETQKWTERLGVVERAIKHLIDEGG